MSRYEALLFLLLSIIVLLIYSNTFKAPLFLMTI